MITEKLSSIDKMSLAKQMEFIGDLCGIINNDNKRSCQFVPDYNPNFNKFELNSIDGRETFLTGSALTVASYLCAEINLRAVKLYAARLEYIEEAARQLQIIIAGTKEVINTKCNI